MMHFEIYLDTRNEWRWRLIAENGEPIADCAEGYVRRIDCEHGVELVRKQAPGAVVVRRGE